MLQLLFDLTLKFLGTISRFKVEFVTIHVDESMFSIVRRRSLLSLIQCGNGFLKGNRKSQFKRPQTLNEILYSFFFLPVYLPSSLSIHYSYDSTIVV